MIIFDTETTGFPRESAPLEEQPRIIEIGAIKLAGAEEIARFQSLVNPGIPLPAEIVKITGITDEMLQDAPTFPLVVRDLSKFFLGETEAVAHYVNFDRTMLVNELRRIGWEYRFPYPGVWVDSVPISGHLKLNVWAQQLLGDEYQPQQHRALGDCEMLLACLRKQGYAFT